MNVVGLIIIGIGALLIVIGIRGTQNAVFAPSSVKQKQTSTSAGQGGNGRPYSYAFGGGYYGR